jgi:hypothetical protein
LPYSVPAGFGADALQQEHHRSPTNVRTLTPNSNDQRQGIIMAIFVLYPPVLSWESVVYSSWFNKSEFERRKLMYPLISVFIIVVGALLLVFANKIIKNNKVNRIGIKVVGGILIIVGLLLLYFLLSGKLTLPLSK